MNKKIVFHIILEIFWHIFQSTNDDISLENINMSSINDVKHLNIKNILTSSHTFSHSSLKWHIIILISWHFFMPSFIICMCIYQLSVSIISFSYYIIPLLHYYGTFVAVNEPISRHYYYVRSVCYSQILTFYLMHSFCSRILSKTSLKFNDHVSLVSSSLWHLSQTSCALVTLTVLRRTGQVFCISVGNCLKLFSWLY